MSDENIRALTGYLTKIDTLFDEVDMPTVDDIIDDMREKLVDFETGAKKPGFFNFQVKKELKNIETATVQLANFLQNAND